MSTASRIATRAALRAGKSAYRGVRYRNTGDVGVRTVKRSRTAKKRATFQGTKPNALYRTEVRITGARAGYRRARSDKLYGRAGSREDYAGLKIGVRKKPGAKRFRVPSAKIPKPGAPLGQRTKFYLNSNLAVGAMRGTALAVGAARPTRIPQAIRRGPRVGWSRARSDRYRYRAAKATARNERVIQRARANAIKRGNRKGNPRHDSRGRFT